MTDVASYGESTRQLMTETLSNPEVSGVMVIMRHSARHYDHENPINEPFMGLTETGKEISHAWGIGLPSGLTVGFYSSFIGRCIETAYLIDKGYVRQGGDTRHNIIEKTLSPYYVRDAQGLFKDYIMDADFFGKWFAGEIPAAIIDHPETIAADMRDVCVTRLKAGSGTNCSLDICVTHDWNLYVLRQHFLGLHYEAHGKVGYLDGVVIFQKDGRFFIAAPGGVPREMPPNR